MAPEREIVIYNRAGLNPDVVQLEALVTARQFVDVCRNGYVTFDPARAIWRLTDSGHDTLVSAEIAGELDLPICRVRGTRAAARRA